MAVFMSDGLADIIGVPSSEIVIEASTIKKFKITDKGDAKEATVTFVGEPELTGVIHMIGNAVKIKIGDRGLECRVHQASVKSSANTYSIKGIVLNTY